MGLGRVSTGLPNQTIFQSVLTILTRVFTTVFAGCQTWVLLSSETSWPLSSLEMSQKVSFIFLQLECVFLLQFTTFCSYLLPAHNLHRMKTKTICFLKMSKMTLNYLKLIFKNQIFQKIMTHLNLHVLFLLKILVQKTER